jgi:hypothetical protein
MKLFDTQPLDAQNDILFYKCPLCTKSSQVVTYSRLVPVESN